MNIENYAYYSTIKTLTFHSDWNCLMEVVEKIEKLPDTIVTIQEQCASVYYNEKYFKVESNESKFKAVYNACAEFIKWYLKYTAKK